MRVAIYHNLPSGGAKRTLYQMTRRLAESHVIDVYTLSTADHGFCDLRPFVRHHHTVSFETWPLFSSPFGLLNHGVRTADIRRLRRVERAIAAQINNGSYHVGINLHDANLVHSSVVFWE